MSSSAPTIAILHAQIITEEGLLQDGALVFQGNKIVYLGETAQFLTSPYGRDESCRRIEAAGRLVLPGFVDIHVHGGNGSDFMDASRSAYDAITTFHARNGTTSMTATTVTAGPEQIQAVLQAARDYRSGPMPGASLTGVHLEGPFISPAWPGAQNPAFISPPRLDWLQEWIGAYPKLVQLVTLAPERELAQEAITWLTGQGITSAAGHTDATYDQMMQAADCGLRHAVHTFNAMKGVHHREPGTAGAVLTDDRITAEVIADGLHVHPACIRLLARQKGPRGLVLITDAISAAGLGPGSYELGGLAVTVKEDGAARLKDGGALAGSTLTMIDAFRFAVRHGGLSLTDASLAASGNPARVIGIDHETGSLAAGKHADILMLKDDLTIEQVWIKGREAQL